MNTYLLKRLALIPVTLLLILIVNFTLIHLMKEEPNSSIKSSHSLIASQNPTFSSFYGQGKPLFINLWSFTPIEKVEKSLEQPSSNLKNKAPYLIEPLAELAKNGNQTAMTYLILACIEHVSSSNSDERFSSKQIQDLIFLEEIASHRSWEKLDVWLKENQYDLFFSFKDQIRIAFTDTCFYTYFKKVLSFDFGQAKGEFNQPVVKLVFSHLRVSLLLLIGPMLITFILSQLIGLWMALTSNRVLSFFMTFVCMILYALPLYLAIPLFIEKLAIPYHLPIYGQVAREGRGLFKALFLPYLALIYGSLALYTRFNKTLFLTLFKKPHIKVAKGMGLSTYRLLFVHTLRQSIMTLVPLFLGGIGTFLGGVILVETLFEIRGFGFLFYQAILQRDHHVLLFATLVASLLSILGHLLADLFIIKFDPRISGDEGYHPFERA